MLLGSMCAVRTCLSALHGMRDHRTREDITRCFAFDAHAAENTSVFRPCRWPGLIEILVTVVNASTPAAFFGFGVGCRPLRSHNLCRMSLLRSAWNVYRVWGLCGPTHLGRSGFWIRRASWIVFWQVSNAEHSALPALACAVTMTRWMLCRMPCSSWHALIR